MSVESIILRSFVEVVRKLSAVMTVLINVKTKYAETVELTCQKRIL